MLRLRMKEILQERGKSKYFVYKQLGMSQQNFDKMINHDTQSIRFEIIEALCVMFDITPNELFEFDFDQPPT